MRNPEKGEEVEGNHDPNSPSKVDLAFSAFTLALPFSELA